MSTITGRFEAEREYRHAVQMLWRSRQIMRGVHRAAIEIYRESDREPWFVPIGSGYQLRELRRQIDQAVNAFYQFQEMLALVFQNIPMYIQDALFYYEDPQSEFWEITTPIFTAPYWIHLAETARTEAILSVGPAVSVENVASEIFTDVYHSLDNLEQALGTEERTHYAAAFCEATLLDFEGFGRPILRLGVMLSAAYQKLKEAGHKVLVPRTVLNVSGITSDTDNLTFQEVETADQAEALLQGVSRVQWYEDHGLEVCGGAE